MDIQELLSNKELQAQFEEEYYNNPPGSGKASGQTLEEAFKEKINELLNDEQKHHWDCKCLIHA